MRIDDTDTPEDDSGHGNPPPKDPPKTGGRSVPQEPTDAPQ